MSELFQKLRQQALDCERTKISIDGSFFTVLSDTHDLSEIFLKDGKYDYRIFSLPLNDHENIWDTIFSCPYDQPGHPAFGIAVFDWNEGKLTRQDIAPAMRMSAEFAVVVGAVAGRDDRVLQDLFATDLGMLGVPVLLLETP